VVQHVADLAELERSNSSSVSTITADKRDKIH